MIHSECKITEKEYTIEYDDDEITLYAGPWTSLSSIWKANRYLFAPGTIVRISDNMGHTKTFTK